MKKLIDVRIFQKLVLNPEEHDKPNISMHPEEHAKPNISMHPLFFQILYELNSKNAENTA